MAKIPGTFKSAPPEPRRDIHPQARMTEAGLIEMGALHAECWIVGECRVICSREPSQNGEYGWHLSISHPSRYPTWDEVKTAVYGIPTIALQPGRTFAQLLGNPAGGPWVNVHENVFHLFEIEDQWR